MATFTDDFNRADNATSLGANWTTHAGTWGILTNQADSKGSGGNEARYSANASATGDHYCEIKLYDTNLGSTCRHRDTGGRYYLGWRGANDIELLRSDDGTFASLGSFTVSFTAGDVIRIEASGSTIKVFYNGTERISATDTNYPGTDPIYRYGGMRAFDAGKNADDWLFADISSGQTIVLGQALETDSTSALTKTKTRSVTQALETDTAQPLGKAKTRTVGQSLETDATFALGKAKRVTLGLATETDSTFPLGGARIISVGQALETDSGLTATRLKQKAVGQPTEADTTGRFWLEEPSFTTSGTSDAFGSSSSVAIPAGSKKGDIAVLGLYLLGGSSEDPTPTFPAGFQVIAHERRDSLKLWVAWKRLQSAETGSYTITVPVDQWMLTHAVLVHGARPNMIPVQAANSATAAFTTTTPTTSVTATEPLLLHFVSTNNLVTTTPPTGFTEALDTEYLHTNWQLPRSSGSHSAAGGTASNNTDQLVALIALSDTANSGNQWLLTPPAIVPETDTALALTRVKTVALGLVTEADSTFAAAKQKIRSLALTNETDSGLGIEGQGLGLAVETDSAQPVGRRKKAYLELGYETNVVLVVKKVALGYAREGYTLLRPEPKATAWYFRPPGPERAWGGIRQPLMRRADIHRGLTVLKNGSAYTQVENPTNEQFETADVVYLGGYAHRVSSEEATNLTNAGYGGSLRYE